MSIALMTLAWKTKLQPSQKMALLAMCDWANDEGGSVHPSIARVAQRLSCSDRQAQRIIHSLVDGGWIDVIGNVNGGKPGQSRMYRINVKKLETGDMDVTGDKMSRVTSKTETGDIQDTRRVTSKTETGDIHVTLSTIEPPLEPPLKNTAHALAAPDGVCVSVWQDFVSLRKAKKAPLTKTAVDGLRRDAEKVGLTLEGAIRVCCERGWAGFRADWYAGQGATRQTNQPTETAYQRSKRELFERATGQRTQPHQFVEVLGALQ